MTADSLPAPLRVVYLDHVARLGGGEIALVRLLSALAVRAALAPVSGRRPAPAVSAHVILGEDGPLVDELTRAGARVEVLPIGPAGSLRKDSLGGAGALLRGTADTAAFTARLARRLRELAPEVVHTNSLKSGFYGCAAARAAGVPAVWHLRDRVAADYLPAAAVRATRTALRTLPALVLCNSEATRSASFPHGVGWGAGRGPAPVVLPDPYDPPAPAVPAQREAGGPLVIGMVGRLAPWKGQDVFLRGFARAFPGGTVRARVIGTAMFGEDDYAFRLEQLAKELGVDDRVDFAGFRPDVPVELAGLDVLVHASVTPEPFGQVIVEGMAAGLPVVAAAAGGPAEIVRPGIDGLLCPPGDDAALAGVLRRLAADPALRATLGEAARVSARRYRGELAAAAVERLYGHLLASRSENGGRAGLADCTW